MPTFQTSDDVRVHYELEGAAGGRLPPVLLLHGIGSSSELNWRASGALDALHAAGRRTLALDARGHGHSDAPTDARGFGEARIAQDARELLDQLDLERVDVVGYSMGAIVALLLTADDPRVRRLVLGGVGAAVVEFGGAGPHAVPDGVIPALKAERLEDVTDPVGRSWRSFVERHRGNPRAVAAQAEAMHAAPIPLEHIAAPTLLIAGDRDPIAARPEVLTAALPQATLLVLHDDHMGTFHNPRFAAAVVAFLA